MGTLLIIEVEIPSQLVASDLGTLVTLEIDFLILHRPPQSFGEK
jgi:hypothetical protein